MMEQKQLRDAEKLEHRGIGQSSPQPPQHHQQLQQPPGNGHGSPGARGVKVLDYGGFSGLPPGSSRCHSPPPPSCKICTVMAYLQQQRIVASSVHLQSDWAHPHPTITALIAADMAGLVGAGVGAAALMRETA